MEFGLVDYGKAGYVILGSEDSYIAQVFEVKKDGDRKMKVKGMADAGGDVLVFWKAVKDEGEFIKRVERYKGVVRDDGLIIFNDADKITDEVYKVIKDYLEQGIGMSFVAKNGSIVRKKLAGVLGISSDILFKIKKDPFFV